MDNLWREPFMTTYGNWSSLQEEPLLVDEAFVQRLWFEQLYKTELETVTGEKIRLIQPGFWNHGAGPDFLRASLVDAQGRTEVGAVEVHCQAPDWKQHGHEQDKSYNEVILHVVWKSGPKNFFAADSTHRSVRTLELSSQLKVPFLEARRHFTTTDLERKVGARIGICQKELAALSTKEVTHLLEEAGWFRFQRRAELWSMRVTLHGQDQALWLGLADALGYSRNREAFGSLAQRLPLGLLQSEKSAVKREAFLFGLAGFLPGETLPKEAIGNQWFRALWDEWWQERAAWEQQGLPAQAWNLRGVRPLNRPERRLAVLSLLSDRGRWKQFVALVKEADFRNMWEGIKHLEHPFWDRHYTLKSSSGKKIQLLGQDRCLRFWFNVVGPLALSRGQVGMKERLQELKTSESMHPAAVAAVRLLGGRSLGSSGRSLLVKEGLLQIYQDFCLKDFSKCGDCGFPDLLKNWKK
jgi:hypothetical protein